MEQISKNAPSKRIYLFKESSGDQQTFAAPIILIFHALRELAANIYKHLTNSDMHTLVIPDTILETLTKNQIDKYAHISKIYIYCDNKTDLSAKRMELYGNYSKFEFLHEKDLDRLIEKLKLTNIISGSGQAINREAIIDTIKRTEKRVVKKLSGDSNHLANTQGEHAPNWTPTGYDCRASVDEKYVCAHCKLVLCNPYQLGCGHRRCRNCISKQNDPIYCSQCSLNSTESRPNFAFTREPEQVVGSWKNYGWPGHLPQYRLHVQRDQQGSFGSSLQSSLPTENIIKSRYVIDTPSTISSIIHKKHTLVNKSFKTAHEDLKNLSDNQQRIHDVVDTITTSLNELHETRQDLCNMLNVNDAFLTNKRFIEYEVESLQEESKANFCGCFDGTFIWKIDNVSATINDAVSERQKSIYSQPFFTSNTGYKLCLRLYLNGDGDSRGNHLSLYLVILKHTFDPILEWPFRFKITFTLINQLDESGQQGNVTKSFYPVLNSQCFHRPTSHMNEGFGFKEFISIEEFRTNGRFIVDDTMFIQVSIDFFSKPENNSINSEILGSPNDENHVDNIDLDINGLIEN